MAADSLPLMPNLQRSARYLAAASENELIETEPDTFAYMRTNCSRNIELAADFAGTSALECRFYFPMAMRLKDYGAARRLLDRWADLAPDDSQVNRRRIDLELAAGNFASALNLADGFLSRDPTDLWALEQRHTVFDKIQELVHTPAPAGRPMPNLERTPTRAPAH